MSIANETVERAALSCFLHGDVDMQREMLQTLKPTHFASSACRCIYDAAVAILATKRQADPATVIGELEARGALEGIGGASAVGEIAIHSQGSAGWKNYHATLEEMRWRRELYQLGSEYILKAKDMTSPLDELRPWAEKAPVEIGFDGGQDEGVSMKRAVGMAVERIENIYSGKESVGLSTGFKEVDKFFVGMKPAELIVIGARPSHGKTSIALNIMEHVVLEEQKRVLFFSLEMSSRAIAQRSILGRSNVSESKLRAKEVSKHDMDKLSVECQKIAEADITIYDRAGVSMSWVSSMARRAHGQRPVDLVVIDYLQLLKSSTRRKNEDKVAEIGENAQLCKELSKELSLPVILLCQLNRDPEKRSNKKPGMSDLRGSGEIEQHADKIGLLHRKEDEDKDENCDIQDVDFLVEKHRDGPTGVAHLEFIKSKTQFRDALPY